MWVWVCGYVIDKFVCTDIDMNIYSDCSQDSMGSKVLRRCQVIGDRKSNQIAPNRVFGR